MTELILRSRKAKTVEELISFKDADETYEYLPEKGDIVYKKHKFAKTIGKSALLFKENRNGTVSCYLNHGGTSYSAMYMIYFLLFGNWPAALPRVKDGNGENLRLSNLSFDKAKNFTGYRGVYPNPTSPRFEARYSVPLRYVKKGMKKRLIYIGMYDTPTEAASAYNKKAIEIEGDDAVVNTATGALISAGAATDELRYL